MRMSIVFIFLTLNLVAIDYSNMFLTKERFNSYSSLADNPEQETEAYYNALESQGGKYAKKSAVHYQGHLAMITQKGFTDRGYAVIVSALKSFPKFFPKYTGIFAQGDLLYTYNALVSADGQQVKDEIALSAYGGYEHQVDELVWVSGRVGTSFLTGSSSFKISYGLGAKYRIKSKGVDALVNILRFDGLTIFTVGAQYAF